MTTAPALVKRESIHIRLDKEVLTNLDKIRGDTTRSMFLERACQRYIKSCQGGIRRSKK